MLVSIIGMVTMELDVVTRFPAWAPDPALICTGLAGHPGMVSWSWRLVDPSQGPGPPAFIRHSVPVALSPAIPRGLKVLAPDCIGRICGAATAGRRHVSGGIGTCNALFIVGRPTAHAGHTFLELGGLETCNGT